jgi:nitrite reductase/ring-hydroxylating ferredoxin subunit
MRLPPPAPIGVRARLTLCAVTSVSTGRQLTADLYSSFDWREHWYPMAWARDLATDAPARFTLFDTDYAVVLRSGGRAPLALRDACPHRLAALSEGRVTEQGWLQCAYHGWAFASDGECKAVPQLPDTVGLEPLCATAASAVVSQGILWLSPSPTAADAPPRVPEMDDPSFKWSPAVRDLPIDYSLLVENILDPDHGLFAHQQPAFDLYSATRGSPQSVRVSAGPPLQIASRVAAEPKLVETKGGFSPVRTAAGAAAADTPSLTGTSTFSPPSLIVTCRRDAAGNSSFLTCFFLSPTGVGRTRFLSAGVGKIPFSPPRWLTHLLLNRFLDQVSATVPGRGWRHLGVCLPRIKRDRSLCQAWPRQGFGSSSSGHLARLSASTTTLALSSRPFHSASLPPEFKIPDRLPLPMQHSTSLSCSTPHPAPHARYLLVSPPPLPVQDTYLLATQQPHVLRAELQAALDSGLAPASASMLSPSPAVAPRTPAAAPSTAAPHATESAPASMPPGDESHGHRAAPVPFRRTLYKYRSPTERLLLEVGKFLDATVPRMPRRYTDATPFLAACPPRYTVLDRFAQHTSVCPDSLGLVSRLRALQIAAWAAALFLAIRRLAAPTLFPPFAPPPLGASAPTLASAAVYLVRVFAGVTTWLAAVAARWAPPVLLAALGWGARSLLREFRFAFSETDRDASLAKVPGVFQDSRLGQPPSA